MFTFFALRRCFLLHPQDPESVRTGFEVGYIDESGVYVNNHVMFKILVHPVTAQFLTARDRFYATEIDVRRRQLLEDAAQNRTGGVVSAGSEVREASLSLKANQSTSLPYTNTHTSVDVYRYIHTHTHTHTHTRRSCKKLRFPYLYNPPLILLVFVILVNFPCLTIFPHRVLYHFHLICRFITYSLLSPSHVLP